jgi:C-terminal peptidase prc
MKNSRSSHIKDGSIFVFAQDKDLSPGEDSLEGVTDREELSRFYANIITLVLRTHVNVPADIDHNEMAQAALQYVLQALVFYGGEEVDRLQMAEYEGLDPTEVKAFTLPSGHRIEAIKPQEEMQDVREHMSFLYDHFVAISNETTFSLERLVDLAVNGALLKLIGDDYTSFERYQTEEHGGYSLAPLETIDFFGVDVSVQDEGFLVLAVNLAFLGHSNDTFRSGDLITHIGGQLVSEESLIDILKQVEYSSEQAVEVTIVRDNEEIVLTTDILRDESSKASHVRGALIDENVALVHIDYFNEDCYERFKEVMQSLNAQAKEKGFDNIELVLDVSDNSGGYLDAAIKIADSLLQPMVGGDKKIVGIGGKSSYETKYTGNYADEYFPVNSVTVLQNYYSASASELLAGALQDAGARVIGTRSHGKGSMQVAREVTETGNIVNQFNTAAIGAVKVTEGLFFSGISSLSNQGCGVIPDVCVEYDDFRNVIVANALYESNTNTGLVPPEHLRSKYDPGCYVRVKPEFSGDLPNQTLQTLPEYLIEWHVHEEADERSFIYRYALNTQLAAALYAIKGRSEYVDVSDKSFSVACHHSDDKPCGPQ